MTLKQFNNIKVGESCYLPDLYRKGKFIGTEVLEKDNVFKKLKVLLGRKWLSYRYLQMGKIEKCSCMVGILPVYAERF